MESSKKKLKFSDQIATEYSVAFFCVIFSDQIAIENSVAIIRVIFWGRNFTTKWSKFGRGVIDLNLAMHGRNSVANLIFRPNI